MKRTRKRSVHYTGIRKAEDAGAQLCWAASEPGLQAEREKREDRKPNPGDSEKPMSAQMSQNKESGTSKEVPDDSFAAKNRKLQESAIARNLELTPEQRIEAHENARQLAQDLREAGERQRARSQSTA